VTHTTVVLFAESTSSTSGTTDFSQIRGIDQPRSSAGCRTHPPGAPIGLAGARGTSFGFRAVPRGFEVA
jgi:hypothetical protein